jgi:chromosome segregation ATPase
MPPTVKSLEERLDDFGEELESLKAQLTNVTAKLEMLAATISGTQAQLASIAGQLAVIATKLDSVTEQLKTTNGRLDGTTAKLEGFVAAHAALEAKLVAADTRSRETVASVTTLTDSHTTFKAKAETTFGFLRWAGVFTAGTLVTVIFAAFAVVRTAGNLESNLQQQQKAIEEIKRDVGEIRAKQK